MGGCHNLGKFVVMGPDIYWLTCLIHVLVKNMVHARKGIVLTQRCVSSHGSTCFCC